MENENPSVDSVKPFPDNDFNKVSKAIRILNDAALEEKKLLQEIFTDKYDYLKKTLLNTNDQMESAINELTNKATTLAEETKKVSLAKVKKVDEHVHQNPWGYIIASSTIGLLMGFILGRSSLGMFDMEHAKKNTPKEHEIH